MGLRRIFAARAEEEKVKDIEGHEAADDSVYLATSLTSLHRQYIIGAGWSEVLAEVLIQAEAPYRIDGYDTIVLCAPLWVRTAPPPLDPEGKSIKKPKPAHALAPPAQPPMGSEPPPPLPSQPEPPSPTLARGIGVAGATMAGIGGLLMILGSLLPWLVAVNVVRGAARIDELQGDNGSFILILGAATLLVAVARLAWRRTPEIVRRSSIATGIAAGLVTTANYLSIRGGAAELATRPGRNVTLVGTGFWAILAGATLAIAGGLLSSNDPER